MSLTTSVTHWSHHTMLVRNKNPKTERNWTTFKQTFWKKVSYWKLMHWTFPKKIFVAVLIIILLGSILLYTPWAFNHSDYEYVNNEYVFHINPSVNAKFNSTGGEVRTLQFNFLEALFLATSAFTDTGLSRVSVGDDLSFFGQFVVFSLIEVGGFGYASLFYLFALFIQKITRKKSLSSALLNIERGGTKIADSPTMIWKIFVTITLIQIVFGFTFSILIFAIPFQYQQTWSNLVSQMPNLQQINFVSNHENFALNPQELDSKMVANLFDLTFDNTQGVVFDGYQNYPKALWYGFFSAASAVNNAGFDLFGNFSIQLFRNDLGLIIQIFTIFLFLIGGVGFPVIYDVLNRISYLFKYYFLYRVCERNIYRFTPKNKFSFFSKMCLINLLVFAVITILFLYATEYGLQNIYGIENHMQKQTSLSILNYPDEVQLIDDANNITTVKFFGESAGFNKNFSLFFIALSTRSAGFSTISVSNFNDLSLFLLVIYMFIGAAPSSTGGGIRTTTLLIIHRSFVAWLRKTGKTTFWKKGINNEIVLNAYIVLVFGVILLFATGLVFYLTSAINNGDGFNALLNSQMNAANNINFVHFLFEVSSAFGTSGLSVGLTNIAFIGWWNLLLLIVMMFIGQIGISNFLLTWARKQPKIKFTNYLDEPNVKLG